MSSGEKSFNDSCAEELLEESSGFVRATSLIFIVLIVSTTAVLTVAFCIHRNDFSVLRTRANILTYTSVFGNVLQISWAIDSYWNREGFPCLILNNLIFFIFTLQVVPRAITAAQIYYKFVLNRQLAKFELVSAINLGNYKDLDLDVKKISKRKSFCSWSFGHFCDVCFWKKRQEKALSNISGMLLRGGRVNKDAIAMNHFPQQYVFFLASKPFGYSLQLIAILITLIILIVELTKPFCYSPCAGELQLLPLVFVAALLVTPSIGIYMYQIRNEPDTLGLIWEFRMYNIYAGGLGSAAVLLLVFKPGDLEENGDIRWPLLWVLASWIDILFCFGYPLYLARKQEKYRKKHRFSNVSLGKVLESEVGRDLFKTFLVAEMSVENYMFWTSAQSYVEEFATRTQEENIQVRNAIAGVYLDVDSQLGINISAHARQESLAMLNQKEPQISDFLEVTKEVVATMETDSFTRFTRTAGYKEIFGGEEADVVLKNHFKVDRCFKC